MTPSTFIIHFGTLVFDKCGKYYYARIYCAGLNEAEARRLCHKYPATYMRKYKVKHNPDDCWRWTSGGLVGLDQVLRDIRMSHALDYNFIECMWNYVWCKRMHRAEIGRRIRLMMGNAPMKLKIIIREQPEPL